MTTETMSPRLREEFVELIAKQTGIEIRAQNYGSLGDNIFSRVKELNLLSPQAYYDLLSQFTPEGEEEWQKFVCLMTNRESYFFRDKGQFSLLRNTILPELIRRNQRTKSIRICSAGCSTGQEPYSIAILLKELIPDFDYWNLTILGVDINRESLAQGQKAFYNTWSFRQVEEDIKTRYFKNSAGYYQLDDDIRKLVKFHQVNLVRDGLPRLDAELHDMDFIICRNVFIYFTDMAIGQVVEKFYNTLKPNGYLITGHAELANHHVKAFQTKLFSESVIYQRRSGQFSHISDHIGVKQQVKPEKSAFEILAEQLQKNQTQNQPISLPTITPIKPLNFGNQVKTNEVKTAVNSANPEEELLKEVEQLIKNKSYHLAQKKLEQILQKFPKHFKSAYLMAELEANLGKYDSAQKWCEIALHINSFAPNPYHLLAHIAEEKGSLEEAKQALKKVIYLDPNSVAAYVNLANLYQREGDLQRTKKMKQSALKILQGLPEDTVIPELGNISAQELISELQN